MVRHVHELLVSSIRDISAYNCGGVIIKPIMSKHTGNQGSVIRIQTRAPGTEANSIQGPLISEHHLSVAPPLLLWHLQARLQAYPTLYPLPRPPSLSLPLLRFLLLPPLLPLPLLARAHPSPPHQSRHRPSLLAFSPCLCALFLFSFYCPPPLRHPQFPPPSPPCPPLLISSHLS